MQPQLRKLVVQRARPKVRRTMTHVANTKMAITISLSADMIAEIINNTTVTAYRTDVTTKRSRNILA
jgi:hypothetical protein